jgi:hypothetical protein
MQCVIISYYELLSMLIIVVFKCHVITLKSFNSLHETCGYVTSFGETQ